MKRIIFLSLCLLPLLPSQAQTVEVFMVCDLNRDGAVDFADFIFFAKYFNTPLHQQPTVAIDTIVVTKTETIKIFDTADGDAGIRAGKLIGYWRFSKRLYHPSNKTIHWTTIYDIHFNAVSDVPGEDGEYTVYGSPFTNFYHLDHNNVVINTPFSVKYNEETEQYILWGEDQAGMPHRSSTGHLQVFFKIQNRINDDLTQILHAKLIEQTVIADSMRIGYYKMSNARRNVVTDTIWYHASNFHNLEVKRISRKTFMSPLE